jgi:hypothetical protein
MRELKIIKIAGKKMHCGIIRSLLSQFFSSHAYIGPICTTVQTHHPSDGLSLSVAV